MIVLVVVVIIITVVHGNSKHQPGLVRSILDCHQSVRALGRACPGAGAGLVRVVNIKTCFVRGAVLRVSQTALKHRSVCTLIVARHVFCVFIRFNREIVNLCHPVCRNRLAGGSGGNVGTCTIVKVHQSLVV